MMPFGGIAAKLERDRLRAEGVGDHQNAVKYLGQDYEALKQQCVENGVLFEDPQFPAISSVLGFKELGPNSGKTRGIIWKRPSVSKEPSEDYSDFLYCLAIICHEQFSLKASFLIDPSLAWFLFLFWSHPGINYSAGLFPFSN